MHYTPAQTRWFIDAIDAAERKAHREQVAGIRMAQADDGKALQKYLDALND